MSERLALIIGNSLYRDKTLAKLTAPEADVGAFADALLDGEMGAFDDVKLLVNMASHTVRREISEFFSRKSRDDMLLFYFSGHGVLDDRGRLYLALKDTDTKLLRGTAIPANYITDEMDNSRSQRQVLILDCCHSGAFARGSKSATGASVGTASTFEGAGFGRVVLTASDATQYAWEGNQIIGEAENSLFTHFLVKGIQTGEADANKDGKITIDEIYDYAYTHILKETPKQTPGKWSFKEQGELIIARSPEVQEEKQKPEPKSPEETQEVKLEKLYTDGLGALLAENWDSAIETFGVILEMQPDYLDVEARLENAQRQKKMDTLYNQGVSHYEAGNLDESIKNLEELILLAPEYKNADDKLDQAKADKKLADLYDEARQLLASGEYESVVKNFDEIHALAPNFDDKDGLLEKAKAKLAEQESKQQLDERYRQAMVTMEAGNLEDARKILLQIQAEKQGFRDVDEQLARVDAMIAAAVESTPTIPQMEIKPPPPDDHVHTLSERLATMPKWLWGVSAFAIVGVGALVVFFGLRLWGGSTVENEPKQVIAPVVDTPEVSEDITPIEEDSPEVTPEYTNTPFTNNLVTVTNPVDGAIAILIPAGEFKMGADPHFGLSYCEETLGESVCTLEDFQDEAPVHSVYLENYFIYQTEVTTTQFSAFLNSKGNQSEGGALWYDQEGEFSDIYEEGGTWFVDHDFADHPVVQVTWYGANAYCNWAGGRLPTEAEWEKAARGESDYVFPWGDQFNSLFANVDDEIFHDENKINCSPGGCDGYDDTAPVGSFPGGASPYGALDMAGNVWEWVADWYDENYYANSTTVNPAGPSSGIFKIRRGGSWWSFDLNVRVANRGPKEPTTAENTLGFRCVIDPSS